MQFVMHWCAELTSLVRKRLQCGELDASCAMLFLTLPSEDSQASHTSSVVYLLSACDRRQKLVYCADRSEGQELKHVVGALV